MTAASKGLAVPRVRLSTRTSSAEVDKKKEMLEASSSAGTATMVDAEQHIENSTVRSPTSVPKSRDANLKDFVRFMGNSTSISQVTIEQIERVRMMHDRFADGARFSFNYNVLLLVASVIAGLGLVSNSSTIIIASMLVSPIMGPVVAMAYSTTIRDWKLLRKALVTETVSLIFCILSGVVIAAICGQTSLGDQWPTSEMTSRGTWENFLVGLPVAFFSGLGVAVSLLDDQTSSLVGVAISASLLPPAVNAGVIWIAYAYFHSGTLVPENVVMDPELLEEFRSMGVISLSLTLANIALIWVSSMFMFRLKEVLPIEKKVFWNDLGVARRIYQKRAFVEQVDAVLSGDIDSINDLDDEVEVTLPDKATDSTV